MSGGARARRRGFSLIEMLVVLALLFDAIIRLAERLLTPWRQSTKGARA